jgi:hypothetical protein
MKLTRDVTEKLKAQQAKDAQYLEGARRRLRRTTQKIRALEEEARHARQAQVGKLADEAGLLLWSDADLAGIFAAVALLAACPNPVAVLEGLLCNGVLESL